MRNTRTISALLALIMVLSMCQGLLTFTAFADPTEAPTEAPVETPTEAPTEAPTETPTEGTSDGAGEPESDIPNYAENPQYIFATPADKLEFVKSKLAQYDDKGNSLNPDNKNIKVTVGDYTLYADAHSGEIIWQNDVTGDILTSNPYDVGYSSSATMVDEKYKLLSQVLLTYKDVGENNEAEMNSYAEASQRGQISLKYITNGIRVDYAMGEQETRKLVPRQIPKERYEELIYSKVTDEKARFKLDSYYVLIDLNDPAMTEAQRIRLEKQYPIAKEMAIYVFDSEAAKRELNNVQAIILPTGYSYDDMTQDHTTTNYQGSDAAPALFRFGIEYTLDKNGSLGVRLAANSLRYDEDNYKLQSLRLLPYFGASNNMFSGYTFIPDGSGALIENDSDSIYALQGKIYGNDNAYHQLIGQNQQIMRLPVFGVTQFTDLIDPEIELKPEDIFDPETAEPSLDITTQQPLPYHYRPGNSVPTPLKNTGYLAVIEEGESLAKIYSVNDGVASSYNSAYTEFTPRASDTYDLKSTLSVSGGTTYTVESKRKFTGSYKLRYFMLSDSEKAEEAGLKEVSYNGMAQVYREYLIENGVLTRLEDTGDDLPLYVESLGAIDTEGSILGIPVSEKTPLTTFDDLKAMYETLAEKGISNINFRLTGFVNGGMKSTYPCKLKFVKELGGDKGFTEFLGYADEKGFGVYPDFDFTYVLKTASFDGFSAKEHLVRTIDDRYITKREYDPTWQMFRPTRKMVVSAASIAELFNDFKEEYAEYGSKYVSVGTLGSDLNSDFDRDDPYDRNDSQGYIEGILETLDEDHEGVMIDGGNSYALKYADHILNISFDSSRFANASYSIPFMGMVLHGYVQYAGTPTNMASDSDYELLKMIENGANPYYMLSYRNLTKLKEAGAEYSKYYSVDFKIWLEDLVENYSELNSVLGSLQEKTIVSHTFVSGERVQEEGEEETYRENISVPNIMTDENEIAQYLEERCREYFAFDLGTVVRVEYEGGTTFYINYNDFDVILFDEEGKPMADPEDPGKQFILNSYDYIKVAND